MARSRSRSRMMPALPAGFRFHPTDEELIVHYLMNQAAAAACPVPIIAEVNIYQCNPWDLPAKAVFGEKEWYFFSPRERKYPNGARPNRAAGDGYWKATGTDKAIVSSTPTCQNIGVKKALVFYRGKPPRGTKTDWIMHEYRLTPPPTTTHLKRRRPASAGAGSSSSMRLDDWVLCRIYKKGNDFQLAGAGDDDDQEQDEGSTVEDHHSLNVIGNTDTSPKRECKAPAGDHHGDQQQQQQLGAAMTITKSCSLTDLLSSIDYSTLSQLLLDVDAPPQSPPLMHAAPLCQPTNHNNNNINNLNVNEYTRVAQENHRSGSSDYSAITNHHGLKTRRLSLDDGGSCNSARAQTQMLPGDSRIIGFSSYCNQQIADHESGFQFQYSGLMSYPFMNQQLLLNNHLQMQ